MAAIVHGWCGYVEKSNDVVFSQMVLNKLWIPDVLIDIIKDYLFVSAAEVLRKFYRLNVNNSITSMWVNYRPLTDVYGRVRQTIYEIGHVYGAGNIQIQGRVCFTCGDFDHRHNNMNGCCHQRFDMEDEPIHLVDNYWEWGHQETDGETDTESDTDEPTPEVTWAVDIPVQNPDLSYTPTAEESEVIRQQAENALWGRQPEEEYDFDDIADYKEYEQEVEMEAYEGRRTR